MVHQIETSEQSASWQIWIEGQPVGKQTTWKNAAKWTAVLQCIFPDHKIGALPQQQGAEECPSN